MISIGRLDARRCGYVQFPIFLEARIHSKAATVDLSEQRRSIWLDCLGVSRSALIGKEDKQLKVALSHFDPKIFNRFCKTTIDGSVNHNSSHTGRFPPKTVKHSVGVELGLPLSHIVATQDPSDGDFIISPNYTLNELQQELNMQQYMEETRALLEGRQASTDSNSTNRSDERRSSGSSTNLSSLTLDSPQEYQLTRSQQTLSRRLQFIDDDHTAVYVEKLTKEVEELPEKVRKQTLELDQVSRIYFQ